MNRSEQISRRAFLKSAGVTALGVFAAGCTASGKWSANYDAGTGTVSGSVTGVKLPDGLVAEQAAASETLPDSIVSLRFQPNEGETRPTDQPGQTRFANEYLEAAMKATKAPTHDDLDFEYGGKTADTDDLYEAVDGLLQEAGDANATIFHGAFNEGMMLPTNTASVTWCNATNSDLLSKLAAEMQQLHDEGRFTFAFYTQDGIYHSGDDVSTGGGLPSLINNNASLVDGRSILFLTMPTDATRAQVPSVYQTQIPCDHPLGSASVAVR